MGNPEPASTPAFDIRTGKLPVVYCFDDVTFFSVGQETADTVDDGVLYIIHVLIISYIV